MDFGSNPKPKRIRGFHPHRGRGCQEPVPFLQIPIQWPAGDRPPSSFRSSRSAVGPDPPPATDGHGGQQPKNPIKQWQKGCQNQCSPSLLGSTVDGRPTAIHSLAFSISHRFLSTALRNTPPLKIKGRRARRGGADGAFLFFLMMGGRERSREMDQTTSVITGSVVPDDHAWEKKAAVERKGKHDGEEPSAIFLSFAPFFIYLFGSLDPDGNSVGLTVATSGGCQSTISQCPWGAREEKKKRRDGQRETHPLLPLFFLVGWLIVTK